jgi:putative flippase GtrA
MIRSAPRYVIVGLTCTLLHNAIMIGCDLIGIHYVVSSLISYGIVVVVGFALHSWFTFQQTPSIKSFLRYAVSMAANYPASVALMFVFCDLARLPVAAAAPLSTLVLFAWNFLSSRWAITGSAINGYRTPAGRNSAKP